MRRSSCRCAKGPKAGFPTERACSRTISTRWMPAGALAADLTRVVAATAPGRSIVRVGPSLAGRGSDQSTRFVQDRPSRASRRHAVQPIAGIGKAVRADATDDDADVAMTMIRANKFELAAVEWRRRAPTMAMTTYEDHGVRFEYPSEWTRGSHRRRPADNRRPGTSRAASPSCS